MNNPNSLLPFYFSFIIYLCWVELLLKKGRKVKCCSATHGEVNRNGKCRGQTYSNGWLCLNKRTFHYFMCCVYSVYTCVRLLFFDWCVFTVGFHAEKNLFSMSFLQARSICSSRFPSLNFEVKPLRADWKLTSKCTERKRQREKENGKRIWIITAKKSLLYSPDIHSVSVYIVYIHAWKSGESCDAYLWKLAMLPLVLTKIGNWLDSIAVEMRKKG